MKQANVPDLQEPVQPVSGSVQEQERGRLEEKEERRRLREEIALLRLQLDQAGVEAKHDGKLLLPQPTLDSTDELVDLEAEVFDL